MLKALALAMLTTVATAAAAPAVTCRLELPATPAESPEGYRRAVLIVTHNLPEPIISAALRADEGGPWFELDLTAPPTHTTRKAVRLPATSIEQTYTIRLFTAASPHNAPAAEARASIRWPADEVDTWRWINPAAHGIFGADVAEWPVQFRQQVLIALAALTLGAGFALLPHRRAVRTSLAAAIALAATAAVVWMTQVIGPPNLSVRSLQLIQRDGGARTHLETLTIVSARRSGVAQVKRSDPTWCVYPDRGHMQADQSVVRRTGQSVTSGAELTAPMRAGDVRILTSGGLAPEQMPRPGRITFEIDEQADRWVVRPSRETPSSLLVIGNRVAPIGAMARRTPRRIPRSEAASIHTLFANGARFGLDDDALKLLRWWNNTHRTAGQVYLVWTDPLGGGPALYAVAVESSSP